MGTSQVLLLFSTAIALAAQAPRPVCAQSLGPEIRRLPQVGQSAAQGFSANTTAASQLPIPPVRNASQFPPLPPDPNGAALEPLPPLAEELWWHGGSYLYAPEGDHLNWPEEPAHEHYQHLRLPEWWQAPQPITLFDDFLGAGPVAYHPRLKWPGEDGYVWDPQLVLYGAYQIIGIALEADNRRRDLVGHQMLVDLDFRLTGTERFHAQWRPIGEGNTGGSYYQFSDPAGYVDNSTGIPERYWFEGEIASIFGGLIRDPFEPRDDHVVVGKFPFQLHNRLLLNDDILGVAVNKNTIYLGDLSNLNIQLFGAFADVDAFRNSSAELYGVNASADWRRVFFEVTGAFVGNHRDSRQDEYYAAISATKFFGPMTATGRVLTKWGDEAGRGPGQLYVLEANRLLAFDHQPLGIEQAVLYATAFRATKGWNSIAGGNFNRLGLAFAVDPLVLISAARAPDDNTGVTLGAQLFRHHEDESFIPEISFEAPQGAPVLGVGGRYQRKTGKRSYFELRGIRTFTDDRQFRREGVFVSQNILF